MKLQPGWDVKICLRHTSCDKMDQAFWANFVLQATNTQGLGMRLGSQWVGGVFVQVCNHPLPSTCSSKGDCVHVTMLDINVAFLFLETNYTTTGAVFCPDLLLTCSLWQTDLHVPGSSCRAYMNTHRRASGGSKVLNYFAQSSTCCCLQKSSSSQRCHCTRRLTMIQVQQQEADRCRH